MKTPEEYLQKMEECLAEEERDYDGGYPSEGFNARQRELALIYATAAVAVGWQAQYQVEQAPTFGQIHQRMSDMSGVHPVSTGQVGDGSVLRPYTAGDEEESAAERFLAQEEHIRDVRGE